VDTLVNWTTGLNVFLNRFKLFHTPLEPSNRTARPVSNLKTDFFRLAEVIDLSGHLPTLVHELTMSCVHGRGSDCDGCARFASNLSIAVHNKENIAPGAYQDLVTAEQFSLKQDGVLVPRRFPKAPAKGKPLHPGVYILKNRKRKWNARAWGACCQHYTCEKHANYKDKSGATNQLCGEHSKSAGTWTPQKQSQCVNHPTIQGNYKDADGKPACAECAHAAGTWTPSRPCVNHPTTEGNYKDADGKPACAECAHAAGTWTPQKQSQCVNHPTTQGNYKDADGKPACAECAHAAGTWTPCKPCVNHPTTQGHYKDADGKLACAECAHAAGTWTPQTPCVNHPTTQGSYKDADGKPACAGCAIKAGTLFASVSGASKVACECFDRLERQIGYKLPHVHYTSNGTVGKEATGLIPGSKARPDSYVPERNEVWLFHGNYYHGYPPGHEKHESICNNCKTSPELYEATVLQMQMYKEHGYTVNYIWEHEYIKTTTKKCPVPIQSVIRNLA